MSQLPLPVPSRQTSGSPLPAEGQRIPPPSSSPMMPADEEGEAAASAASSSAAAAASGSSAMEDAPPSQPHPSYPVLSAGDERKLFTRVYNPTLTKDALFCALPAKWFESWVLYTGFDRSAADNARARGAAPGEDEEMDAADEAAASSSRRAGGGERPGFIDCSVLLAEPPAHLDLSDAPVASDASSSSSSAAAAASGAGTLRSTWIQLRTDLQEGVDFILLNYDAYMRLCEWYGGGPTISRKVVLVGLSQLEMIDLHPQLLVLTPMLPPAPGRVMLEQRRIKPFAKSMLLSEVIDEQKPALLLEMARRAWEAEPELKAPDGKVVPKIGVRERVEGRVWRIKPPAAPAAAAPVAGAAATAPAAAAPASSDPAAPVANLAALAASLSPSEFMLRFDCHPKLDVASKIEFLEWAQGHELLIEYKLASEPWARTGSGKENWSDFAVGDVCDVLDPEGKWFEAQVLSVTNDPVKGRSVSVHFLGWSVKYDETIALKPETLAARFAPKNSWTNGPHVPVPPKKKIAEPEPYYSGGFARQNSVGPPEVRGAVGLRNLGNTCFMNSTLQCLANTPGLTEYFTEGKYVKYINRVNPLGFKGKIAEEYGAMLAEIWSGKYSTVTPRGLKQAVGEFQPRFAGYAQQDSSELLSFLLDGLHEDLNRVLKKPNTAAVDSNGRPDAVVAAESWERHLERNRSVIVDHFQGQLKSSVVCPACHRESITFDPFMFLSVPLPVVNSREIPIVFVSNGVRPGADDGLCTPSLWPVKLSRDNESVSELKADLCGMVAASPASLATPCVAPVPGCIILVEIYQHKIFKVLANDAQAARIGKQDVIVAYHVPQMAKNVASTTEQFTTLQCIHMSSTRPIKRIGVPMVLALPTPQIRAMRMQDLRKLVRDVVNPWLNSGRGWTAAAGGAKGDVDSDLYNICLMDRAADQVIRVLPYTDSESGSDDPLFDLLEMANAFHAKNRNLSSGMSFGLEWKVASPQALAEKLTQDVESLRYAAHILAAHKNTPKKLGLDLSDCLSAFSKEETLRKSEAWYCSACRDHMEASKKLDVFKLPNILIIHLKRFVYDSYRRDKIDSYVDFPLENLDLAPFTVGAAAGADSLYDLYAVSNHYGGMGGGHYTAYVKNLINQKWYNMDDSSATVVSPNAIKTAAAYVLFFRRKTAKFNNM